MTRHAAAAAASVDAGGAWRPPLDPARYDRAANPRPDERRALARVLRPDSTRPRAGGPWPRWVHAALDRLMRPIEDALAVTGAGWRERHAVVRHLLAEMDCRGAAFWAWGRDDWVGALRTADADVRQEAGAAAHFLCGRRDLHRGFHGVKRQVLARKLFGRAPVDAAVDRVCGEVLRWGYGPVLTWRRVPGALCELLVVNGSPRPEDLTPAVLAEAHAASRNPHMRQGPALAARALAALGAVPAAPPAREDKIGTTAALADVPAEWAAWAARWYRTSTLTRTSRQGVFYALLKAGRWLAAHHPEAASPERWTRELAAEYVAAVARMRVGDFAHAPSTFRYAARLGAPLAPRAKHRDIGALRCFFGDCQEWGWLPRRFDPHRALATPRAITALIGPDPRVIADDVWAKLLWAGLNLTAGLRSDELARLRVGCVRWQRADAAVPGTGEILPKDAVCLLDVPVHKTGRPYTKPVDRAVGEAVAAWEGVRPGQPPGVDPKTGELVQFLFAHRGKPVGAKYVNRVLIPLLCRKANVPTSDARGAITSHRARATIATQLVNAREPMTLFELQEWLGHRWPASTQQYAKVTPTRLAKAYADAGYFGRNLRAVEVLIDQEVVKSGAAARGEPWRFYDLGHGYCTYDFFDQCPHRMACAKCAFYRPKESGRAQMLEAKGNLLRLRQDIPLTDDERSAVDDGLDALEKLCAGLADVPTPAGPTPRQLQGREALGLTLAPASAAPRPHLSSREPTVGRP